MGDHVQIQPIHRDDEDEEEDHHPQRADLEAEERWNHL
jgi:hypothetical protein